MQDELFLVGIAHGIDRYDFGFCWIISWQMCICFVLFFPFLTITLFSSLHIQLSKVANRETCYFFDDKEGVFTCFRRLFSKAKSCQCLNLRPLFAITDMECSSCNSLMIDNLILTLERGGKVAEKKVESNEICQGIYCRFRSQINFQEEDVGSDQMVKYSVK